MSSFVARPTPAQFEQAVEDLIRESGRGLSDLQVTRLEALQGTDGCYEIDVTARFTAFGGANFLMLVECKRYVDPIKREKVQVLHAKMQSLGAQKGMMVSTSTFQSGAVEYAKAHGIALVQMMNGSFGYLARSAGGGAASSARFVFGLARLDTDERVLYSNLSTAEAKQRLRELLRPDV